MGKPVQAKDLMHAALKEDGSIQRMSNRKYKKLVKKNKNHEASLRRHATVRFRVIKFHEVKTDCKLKGLSREETNDLLSDIPGFARKLR